MARYYFHVHDGVDMPDLEGAELPSWNAARKEAIRRAGQILDNYADRLKLGDLWCMEVKDEFGLVLFRLDFHVTESPAMRHHLAEQGKLV